MRNLLKALVVVALVAAPSLAATNVQVVVDNANISVGGTATVTVQVKAPAGLGVASLAGSIVATGDAGALTASSFAFAPGYNRVGLPSEPAVVGVVGANGGWAGFGSMQIGDLPTQTTATYGNNVWADFATYTVTANAAGTVTLTFAPGAISGFLPVTTDKVEGVGTNTAVTITVTSGGGCWGDIDGSGMVNGDDLAILAYAWLATPADPNWYAPADLTGDNVVNGDDLAVVAYGWLQCIPK